MFLTSIKKRRQFFNWQLSLEYTDRNFSYLGLRSVTNQQKYVGAGSINFNLGKKVNFNLLGEYIESRNLKNTYSVQGILSAYAKKYLSIKMIGRIERLIDGTNKKSLAFNIDFVPKVKDITFRKNFNLRDRTFTSDVNYVHKLPENRSVGASAGYQKGQGAEIAKGSVRYDGSYCTLNGSHYLVLLSPSDNRSTVQVTNAYIGTSLFFADNSVAISRLIKDSFVIIAPNAAFFNSISRCKKNIAGNYQDLLLLSIISMN